MILTFVKFWPEMCILVACDDGQMDPTFDHSGLVLMLIQKVMFFSSTRVLDIVVKLKEGIMLLALFVPFLMLRLLLASLVIDRMSDWSLPFCGDAATINYQQWSKKYDSCIIHAKYGKLHGEKV